MTNFPKQFKILEFDFVLLPKNAKSPPIHSFNEQKYSWQQATKHWGIEIYYNYSSEDIKADKHNELMQLKEII